MPHASPPKANRMIALVTRLAVGVLLIVVAFAVFFALRATKPQVEQTDPAAVAQSVVVFEAHAVPVQRQWRGYGTAEAFNTADVPARVTATVKSIPDDVLPGAMVTPGQLLVQLDNADFVRQLEIAQQSIAELDARLAQLKVEEERARERLALEDSDVAMAQTDYDRQVNLRERNVNNAQDVDAAQRTLINAKRSRLQTQQTLDLISPRRRSLQAQIASQQSQVNLAELNQQRTTITSPIGGVIQSIDVEVGENLTAGSPVARIVSLSRIEVPIQLPASSRGSVQPGDRVVIRPTSSMPGIADFLNWTTQIVRIAPEQDTATRTLTVFAELTQNENQARLPAPGMFLEAIVSVAQPQLRFIVPRRAIRQGRIQVARNGEIASLPVEVAYTLSGPQPSFGLPDDQWSVIDEVLEEGDLVVVNAATKIADGTLVEPKPVLAASAKTSAAPIHNEAQP